MEDYHQDAESILHNSPEFQSGVISIRIKRVLKGRRNGTVNRKCTVPASFQDAINFGGDVSPDLNPGLLYLMLSASGIMRTIPNAINFGGDVSPDLNPGLLCLMLSASGIT